MPRLEEVEYYLKGLWLLLKGRPEGFQWLDFSDRGFWRSWWAILYCLPPTLLSWVAFRAAYLSYMPDGTRVGPDFFAKLAVVEIFYWIVPVGVFAVIGSVTGYGRAVLPIVIATNWLSVPLQWIYAPQNMIQLFVPAADGLVALVFLVFVTLTAFAYFRVIRRILGGDSLASCAMVLAQFVASYAVQYQLMTLFGIGMS